MGKPSQWKAHADFWEGDPDNPATKFMSEETNVPAAGAKPTTAAIVDDPSEELKRLQKKISGLENILESHKARSDDLEALIKKAAQTPAPPNTGAKTVLEWLDNLVIKKKSVQPMGGSNGSSA